MTKKDYKLIAKVIEDVNKRKATGFRIVKLFADEFRAENARFDREKFYAACGVIAGFE